MGNELTLGEVTYFGKSRLYVSDLYLKNLPHLIFSTSLHICQVVRRNFYSMQPD